MMSERASLFIIVFTAINVLACLWLMWWTARARPSSHHESSTPAAAGIEKTGHVWDGDLEEYNNPLPRWWLWLFIITVVFAGGYLAFYPGLGNFTGTGKWSSVAAYDKQMAEQRARFETQLAALKDKSLRELSQDAGAMATAKNLFGANCSTCHGSDARGARGFPNLTDADWLWGGDENTVLETISNGRHGIMPPWGSALGDAGVNEVASYVVSLSGQKAPEDWVAAGKTRYETLCVGCHGPDAKGNPILGAPNLTDRVWLHGGDFDTVRATITKGRDNQMPAHAELLGESKVKLLAAYVLSLSNSSQTAAAPRAPATTATESTTAALQGGGHDGAP